MVGYYWHGITHGFDHDIVLQDYKERNESLISTHSVNTIFVVSHYFVGKSNICSTKYYTQWSVCSLLTSC